MVWIITLLVSEERQLTNEKGCLSKYLTLALV